MAINNLYVISGLGTVGVIGGGVYLAYPRPSASKNIKSVSDKLREEHFVPMSKNSDWNGMLKKYNDKKGESGARFTNENVDVRLEDLQLSFERALAEDISISSNYSKSRRWCTVPKSLSDLLKDYNLNLLDIGTGNTNQQEWDKLQKSYEKGSDNRIDGLSFNSGNKWQDLRTKCGEISKKDTTEANFEILFNNLRGWCTKEEADKLTE